MSLIWQQIHVDQMRAAGYKHAYILAEWPEDGEPRVVHGPVEDSKEGLEQLLKMDPEHKLYITSCWINDEGEIVG